MPVNSLKPLAKINLALHVGGVRADGYHPVDTLCVYAEAGDVLTVGEPAETFSLTISGAESEGLQAGPGNLILRAAEAFAGEAAVSPLHFHLEKNVPVASGIGGGTSNGAAALILLNQRAEVPLSTARLMKLSEGLGADGPACLMPYLARVDSVRAQGIGFNVSEGPVLPPLHVVLVNPREAVPTGGVFRAFDESPVPEPFDLPETFFLRSTGRLAEYLKRTRNDLAPPARAFSPAIAELEGRLAARPGCLFSRMSGSGATVFGVFTSAEAARRSANVLQADGNWAVDAPLHRGGEFS